VPRNKERSGDRGEDLERLHIGDFCWEWSYVKPQISVREQEPPLHLPRSFSSPLFCQPRLSRVRDSPHFAHDLRQSPMPRHLSPPARWEACMQLRGCNPCHDETSIVITELSGKARRHAVSQPEKQQPYNECKLRAYVHACTRAPATVTMTRHVPRPRKPSTCRRWELRNIPRPHPVP